MDKTVTMSKKELSRLEIIYRVKEKRMTQKVAAETLGISERHMRRLIQAYRKENEHGLISKRRGKPSNNRISTEIIKEAIDLIKKNYHDFGPTLAHEKLLENHDLKISRESVRKLMIAKGFWKTKKQKKETVHPLRERRPCFGELVQIDGSPHAWFENRGPKCTLLVFIDDATGKLLELYFAPVENTLGYFAATRRYLSRHGRPKTFYSDRHGIFKINAKSAVSGSGMTQFGRAAKDLDIEIICANSPQAKGRVERVNKTLQDRLVKEMRLRNISTIEAANDFVSDYMQNFNSRFAVLPRNTDDAHRPCLHSDKELNLIFSLQETRILTKNLIVQYKNIVYQIQTKRPNYALRKVKVVVCENAQGEIFILYKNEPLDFTIFNKQERQAQVLTSKEIDPHLSTPKKPYKPAPDHPWRKYNQPISRKTTQEVLSHGND